MNIRPSGGDKEEEYTENKNEFPVCSDTHEAFKCR